MSFSLVASLRPRLVRVSLVEASRATLGALVGILITGLITRAAMGDGSVAPMLIAPMGASAVLLFAAPSSPLAQPWSILAGNPGRAYPTVPVKAADEIARTGLLDVQPTDVEAVLRQYDEIVNVAPDVLEHLLEQAQIRAFQRSAGQLACASIMSPVAATVLPTTPVRTIWALMQRAELRALPVVDTHGSLVGIISRTDFFAAHLVDQRGQVKKWQIGFPKLSAQDIMSRNVQSALPETLVSKLVSPMVDQGLHQIPIVDASNRVVGMVSQADLLSGLFRSGFDRVAEFPKQPQSRGDVSLSSVPA